MLAGTELDIDAKFGIQLKGEGRRVGGVHTMRREGGWGMERA